MVERGRPSQRAHGGVISPRSSQRSHGTSSSSSHESHLFCKNCCLTFASFICTKVGVGGMVVVYAITGSFGFIAIEGNEELNVYNVTRSIHDNTVQKMWRTTEKYNILRKDEWYENVNETLYEFQNAIVLKFKEGYDNREVQEIWNFPASLMFCLSVFTMIGYGHMTPKTDWGKIATILYACFGIPLYIVYFMNMGSAFAKGFKFLYRSLYKCMNKEKMAANEMEGTSWERQTIIVPSTACIWVIICYILIGTIMFGHWEGWDYLDSCYFSFTSLAKIGMGDLVLGIERGTGSTADNQTKLIINFLYLLIGVSLIAMCYTLMKEEILLKLRTTEHDMKEKIYIIGLRIGLYTEDQPVRNRPKSVRRPVRRR